jgi:hypothetical protein
MPVDVDISKLGEGITLKDLPTIEAYTIEYVPISQFAGVEKAFYAITKVPAEDIEMQSFVVLNADGTVKAAKAGEMVFGYLDKDPIATEPVRDREGNLIYLMIEGGVVRLATVEEIKNNVALVLTRGTTKYRVGIPVAICVHGIVTVPAAEPIVAGADLAIADGGKSVRVAKAAVGETPADVVIGKAMVSADVAGKPVTFMLG